MRELLNKANRFGTNLKAIFKEEGVFTEQELQAKGYNAFIVYLLETALDEKNRNSWANLRKDKRSVPDADELIKFIEQRANNMEYYTDNTKEDAEDKKKYPVKAFMAKPNYETTKPADNNQKYMGKAKGNCALCKQSHSLENCFKFKSMSQELRWNTIRQLKICCNCFKHDYDPKSKYRQQGKCIKCKAQHHTMLHKDKMQQQRPRVYNASLNNQNIITPTALIRITNEQNETKVYRSLFDSGSDTSFVSQRVINDLQLKPNDGIVNIMGIGGQKQMAWIDNTPSCSHGTFQFLLRNQSGSDPAYWSKT